MAPLPRTTPAAELYTRTFFSRTPSVRHAHRSIFPYLILPLFYNAFLMWGCLSLFYGSLLKFDDVSKINVAIVNSDDGFLGQGIVDGIKKSLKGPGPHLRWEFETEVGGIKGGEMSKELVLNEKAWASLQVSANASSSLLSAFANGDASYSPVSAISLYFASARQQVTTGTVAVPAVLNLINPIVSQIAGNTTSTFLRSATNNSLQTALHCPQCFATPFVVSQVDLIPFDSFAALGALSTGAIFLLVFTFQIFTILRAGEETYGHLFTLQTHLIFRTISSLTSYLIISLMYTFILLTFSLPFSRHFSNTGSGFMALWMLNWCMMGACGVVMEAMSTIIGMAWSPFFLNIWLITNASGSFASFEVMPGFYKYGYGMPFYHCIQGTRTIAFGTKSHLGLNFGVLIAWVVVGLAGMYVATAWRLAKGRRSGLHVVP